MFNISKSCWAIFLASILVILFSCEKLVSVQPPISQITNANVLTSDESANAVILGMYAKIINGTSFDFLPTLLPALTADELKSYSTNTAYISYATNNISSADTYIENIWSFSYNVIYQANAFLENIEQAQAVSSGAKAQYSGEALFMRAFMYFNLVNLFGRVPLINFSDVTASSTKPRTSTDSVYKSIINDLTNSSILLGINYITTDRSRANKYAAMALLARVYLYQRQYDSAIQYSSQVINSGTYSINTSLSNVFQKTSPETILQFATPNGYTDIGATFIPNSQLPNFAFTNDFLINVESGDHRVTFWMGTTLNGGATYYYPFKYKNKSINTTNPEYLVTERLAEQYLIRAEAYANENKITQGISDLNVIRFRAGLQANSAQTSVDLLNALAKERRVELFSEWGHRWFDLKRTAEVNTIMSIIKPNTWSPNDTLYPIPLVEMTANSNLIQNTGY